MGLPGGSPFVATLPAVPVLRDGTVYVSAAILVAPADAIQSANYFTHVFALDAATGKERWRYPSAPGGTTRNVCLTQHRTSAMETARSGQRDEN